MMRGLKQLCEEGLAEYHWFVAELAPMMRGLKLHLFNVCQVCIVKVAELAPMMRGLKPTYAASP